MCYDSETLLSAAVRTTLYELSGSLSVKLPAYKAGHQKGNFNLSWGNISPKPPENAIHPRAQHGVFWQNCIKW